MLHMGPGIPATFGPLGAVFWRYVKADHSRDVTDTAIENTGRISPSTPSLTDRKRLRGLGSVPTPPSTSWEPATSRKGTEALKESFPTCRPIFISTGKSSRNVASTWARQHLTASAQQEIEGDREVRRRVSSTLKIGSTIAPIGKAVASADTGMQLVEARILSGEPDLTPATSHLPHFPNPR